MPFETGTVTEREGKKDQRNLLQVFIESEQRGKCSVLKQDQQDALEKSTPSVRLHIYASRKHLSIYSRLA